MAGLGIAADLRGWGLFPAHSCSFTSSVNPYSQYYYGPYGEPRYEMISLLTRASLYEVALLDRQVRALRLGRLASRRR